MQIDFHHGAIYTLARIAGFGKEEAEKLAYASQYTDDAIHGGLISFNNGALFKRTITAHKALNPKNLIIDDNLDVWMPFHFLPGNENKPKDKPAEHKGFIRRLAAKPGSPVAQDMIDEAIRQKDKPYGLHRFGIALHVYADTWAHQEFAGIVHEINEVEDPKEIRGAEQKSLLDQIWRGLKVGVYDILDDAAPPIGHGRALHFPDLPYVTWTYKDGRGKRHERNNRDFFMDAVKHVYVKMKQYLAGNLAQTDIPDLTPHNLMQIKSIFSIREEEGDKRHRVWLKAIENGTFELEPEYPLKDKLSYNPSGRNSWKYQAIGRKNYNNDCFNYSDDFLKSDWKRFHDAAIAHRFYVLHELLPAYGICAG